MLTSNLGENCTFHFPLMYGGEGIMGQLFSGNSGNTGNRFYFAELLLVKDSSVPTFLIGGGAAETTAA